MQLGEVQKRAIGKDAVLASGHAATGVLRYGDTILGPRIDNILGISMRLQRHLQ